MKRRKIARLEGSVEKLAEMRKSMKSPMNQMPLAKKGTTKGAEHPIGALLRRFRGRSRSRRNRGASSGRDEKLSVAVRLVRVGGELAALAEKALARDREHGVVGDP